MGGVGGWASGWVVEFSSMLCMGRSGLFLCPVGEWSGWVGGWVGPHDQICWALVSTFLSFVSLYTITHRREKRGKKARNDAIHIRFLVSLPTHPPTHSTHLVDGGMSGWVGGWGRTNRSYHVIRAPSFVSLYPPVRGEERDAREGMLG